MGRNLIETVMGAVVLAVAAFFLVFAYHNTDLKSVEGYLLKASFTSVGGLERGADVRVNGVKVGVVTSYALDPKTFEAVVSMTILSHIHLPVDTEAVIATEGLLSGKIIKLRPGTQAQRLAAGETLKRTRDFKSIEEMVGELIFLATSETPPTTGGSEAAVPQ